MKIVQANVSLAAKNLHRLEYQRNERLSVWDASGRLDVEENVRAEAETRSAIRDRVTLSDEQTPSLDDLEKLLQTGQRLRLGQNAKPKASNADDLLQEDLIYSEEKIKALFIEMLTKKKITLPSMSDFMEKRAQTEQRANQLAQDLTAAQNDETTPQRQGWGIAYDYHEETRELEQTTFKAQGVVKTADGREIAFETELQMSRESVTVKDFRLRAGDALIDPLVINFAGNAAELTDEKIDFDLDVDGDRERVSFVKAGSGFLVLDRNGDGIATDGSELFGPTTGDGFAELAAHDQDSNGWIDESDAVYNNLRVWTKDAPGGDLYSTLAEKNVGAINLRKVSTHFELQDSTGDTAGKVRTTGVYLTEDGRANTIQQVDLKT